MLGNLASQRRPLAAGDVGDRKQRSPIVGGTIHQLSHVWVGGSERGAVVGSPSSGLAGQLAQVVCPVATETLNPLGRLAAAQTNPDRPVVQDRARPQQLPTAQAPNRWSGIRLPVLPARYCPRAPC
jgi:hypothetical protein